MLSDSSDCCGNMRLFAVLLDSLSARSCSGVFIWERTQLAQKKWRDVTSQESTW